MAMPYCEVFERSEKKYLLSARQLSFMLQALSDRMELDSYGKTRVTSLYFDTPQRSLICRSLEKPLYKEKLRVRRYGEATDACSLVFVEIKKKYKGVVYKRRVGCSHAAAHAYLAGEVYERACKRFPLADTVLQAEALEPRSLQIAREIDLLRERHESLRPSMVIACARAAYQPCNLADDGLRVTFDTQLRYRDCFVQQAPAYPIIPDGQAVMEVKNAGPMPIWLVHALSACKAYPSSFSKYGAAYQRCKGAYAYAGRCACAS